jgi:tRNA(Met) cytidine acetyltransferase
MAMRDDVERGILETLEDLDRMSRAKAVRFIRSLGDVIRGALKNRYRVVVLYPGSDPFRVGAVTARTLLYYERVRRRGGDGGKLKLLYVFHDEFEDARIRKEIVKRAVKEASRSIEPTIGVYEESEKFLGTTFQLLVLDLTNDLKPNDVGRLIGVVEGGGLIVVQAPPWDEWDRMVTIFKRNLLVPGFKEPRHIFISWFKRKLLEHNGNIFIYDLDLDKLVSGSPYEVEAPPKAEIAVPRDTLFPAELYNLALTQDQVNVIKSMEWFYDRPPRGKRKVMVVTADRGRGKSCAVGVGLVGLAKLLGEVKHRVRILVTAPEVFNVQSLMELALKAARVMGLDPRPVEREGYIIEIQGRKFSIEYWEPYRIPKLSADIVAVDEASGIHVPLLHKIWRSHDRIVFAATIHGYEGAGRGFSVRFLSAIKADPGTLLKSLDMEEPIRYARGDPVEKWLFDTLLLDAEPVELDDVDIEDIRAGNLEYVRFNPEELFSKDGEVTLRQLFGIYVLAHYRNEPDDLGLLADAPHHIVRAVRTARSKKIVSAVQIAEEGGLDMELVERLLRGEKIQGNIIPDRLLKHVRLREFGRLKGWRIVRIATHPQVQGRGIGSRALHYIIEEAEERGLDWVGSGFGVNEQLLRFWVKNGFKAVHLSPDRNPVSGEYTTLVIRAIKPEVEELVNVALREFKIKLLNSLHDTYRDLEIGVAQQLLNQDPQGIKPGCKPVLTRVQLDRLWTYCYSFMTYEAVNDIVYELAKTYWMQSRDERPKLSDVEEKLLIAKPLQGNSWDNLEEEFKESMHELVVKFKELARKMAEHYYNIKEEFKIGLTLKEYKEHT